MEEAIDLILTLPAGALWRRSVLGYAEWDEVRDALADIEDIILAANTQRGVEPPRVVRPRHVHESRKARERAHDVKRRLEETKWEEV